MVRRGWRAAAKQRKGKRKPVLSSYVSPDIGRSEAGVEWSGVGTPKRGRTVRKRAGFALPSGLTERGRVTSK